ncbi:MAG TPA: homoserine kinase [Bacillota bacterium]|nr:homoserine kinase [Bacillota bacterium]
MVRVRVPATTANLGPAFDAVGMALQLYNTVEMDIISQGLRFEISGVGADFIPRNGSNLIYKVARKVLERVGFEAPGLHIRLNNGIPVSSGLGSSAAAIVGAMVAANELSGSRLTQEELLVMATELEGHPDNVAPALLGGVVVAVGSEGRVEHFEFDPPEGMMAVVAIPSFPMSTKAARGLLPSGISFQDAVFNVGRTALLVASLAKGHLEGLLVGMEDKLHQPYRSPLIPGMDEVFAEAKKAGAKGVALSGAGPTLIAFTRGNEEKIAATMQNTWQDHGVETQVLVVAPDRKGACIS